MMFSNKSLLLASIAIVSLISNASATAPPVPVEYIENCVECLDNNYSWTVGECHETCDVADASCYSGKYFQGQSSSQICQQANANQPVQEQRNPSSIRNCAPCVRNGFAWTVGECHETCDVADASCFSQKYFPGESPNSICANESSNNNRDSDDYRNCKPCVAHGFAWAVGQCLDSCDEIADAACYSQKYFEGQSSHQICQQAENDNKRAKQRQCNHAGSSCGSCLDAGCNWSGNSCVPSCDYLADAACYGFANFPNGKSSDDICAIAEEQKQDEMLCGAQSNCGMCTRVVKTDGSFCSWYAGADGASGYCGTGGCDMNGTCGATICVEVLPVTEFMTNNLRGSAP